MLGNDIISAMLGSGELVLDPVPEVIQPASVDIVLRGSSVIEPLGLTEEELPFPLFPGDFVLAQTNYIELPTYVAAQVRGKSSLMRRGLSVCCDAGFIDPGFRGDITLELHHNGAEDIDLEYGMKIAQLVFWRVEGCSLSYGAAGLDSHYQDQKGVTPSR